ncbi:hypothetical protein ACP70R_011479 [Stipagrostis hirtigluma subsp. patula]
MAARMSWADLTPELLSCVADRLHALAWYVAARGACAAWRSVLPPASPSLLLLSKDDDDEDYYAAPRASAFSLPSRRAFWLCKLPAGASRCVGSSGGWLAVAGPAATRIVLFNTLSGKRVALPRYTWLDPASVSKIAFAPNPTEDDFAVVAACGPKPEDVRQTLAYISATDLATWSIREIAGDTLLADLLYHDAGGGGKVYCLSNNGSVHVLHVPGGRPTTTRPVLEPLLADQPAGVRFNPADFFAPPYAKLSEILSSAKNLAFFDGFLHQIWRNTIGCSFRVRLPDGGWFRVSENEVFVLRHDPARRPNCWEAVPDLGGSSAFVGGALNSTVSARAGEGVPWIKGNCVYWVSRFGRGPVMVFDMQTRRCTTTGLAPPNAASMAVGWYSVGGDVPRRDDDDGEVLQPQQKHMRKFKRNFKKRVRAIDSSS